MKYLLANDNILLLRITCSPIPLEPSQHMMKQEGSGIMIRVSDPSTKPIYPFLPPLRSVITL